MSNIGHLISTHLILHQSCTDQSDQVDRMIKPPELFMTVSGVFLGETCQDGVLVNLSLVQGTQSAALPCGGEQKDMLAPCTSVHKYQL